MSAKNISVMDSVWMSVRTGATAVAMSLMLLIAISLMIRQGITGERSIKAMILLAAFLSGCASDILQKMGKKYGIIPVLMVYPISGLLLMILAAGIPGNKIQLTGVAITAASMTAGAFIGSLMQNNKMDRRRRKK